MDEEILNSSESSDSSPIFVTDQRLTGVALCVGMLPLAILLVYFAVRNASFHSFDSNDASVFFLVGIYVLAICGVLVLSIQAKRFEFYEGRLRILDGFIIRRTKIIEVPYNQVELHWRERKTIRTDYDLSETDNRPREFKLTHVNSPHASKRHWSLRDWKIRGLDITLGTWILAKSQGGVINLPSDFLERRKEHRMTWFQKAEVLLGGTLIFGIPAYITVFLPRTNLFVVVAMILLGTGLILHFTYTMVTSVLTWTG